MRKKRCDRKHALYCATNILTGEQYVGLTVTNGSAVKRAVKVRWQKHVSRARRETKAWALCEALRFWGPEAFDLTVLEVVRGRKAAHQRERQIIAEVQPALNIF